ncbi:MAG: hypothetical protein AAGC55_05125 [Myxococcota bacterium]
MIASAGCGVGLSTSAGTVPEAALASPVAVPVAAVSASDVEVKAKTRKKRSKSKRVKKRAQRPHWDVDTRTRLTASGGTMDGKGSIDANAPLVSFGGSVRTRVDHSSFRLNLPLSVSHRETQGVALSETRAGSGLELEYRPSKRFRVGVSAKLAGAWRPDWPDQYQPLDDGTLQGSDRKSFWRRQTGAEVYGRPFGRHRLRAKYDYALIDYRQDPMFDAIEEPNHLVPSDHSRHSASLSWAYWARSWKLGAGVDGSWKNYDFAYARDAGTGRTNATSEMPNPLQRIRDIEPNVEVEIELWNDRLELELGYGYEIVDDLYQGYYSYTGHHPELRITFQPSPAWQLRASSELRWRRYGPNSYAEGSNHPALRYGDRRVDRKAAADLKLSRKLSDTWGVFTAWELDIRRTNFPNYVPNVFPSSSQYDINWDYENWQLVAGIEFSR